MRVEPRSVASRTFGTGGVFVSREMRKDDFMYLYNSASHNKEEFKTHSPNHVEMYTCGPTVYIFAHLV